MLDFLTAIWCREKHLSRDIIDATIGPCSNTLKQRFGSLMNAFNRIGFTSARLLNRETMRHLRQNVCRGIYSHVAKAGGTVEGRPGNNYQLRINGELNVTVVIGRTSPAGASRNQNQWRFGYRSRHKPDLLVVARVDHGSSVVRDYFVLPFIYLPPGTWLTVSGLNYTRLEAFHSNTLAPFYDLCARQPLPAEANA